MNPGKISGNCGRLLCCLRYENEMYQAVKAAFPKAGARVVTTKGNGIIDRIDVFNEEAVVMTEDRIPVRVTAGEIESVVGESAASPERRSRPREQNVPDADADELSGLDEAENPGT